VATTNAPRPISPRAKCSTKLLLANINRPSRQRSGRAQARALGEAGRARGEAEFSTRPVRARAQRTSRCRSGLPNLEARAPRATVHLAGLSQHELCAPAP